MILHNYDLILEINDAIEFIKKMKLEKKFEKKYGKPFNEDTFYEDYEDADSELIEEFLEEMDGIWYYRYVERRHYDSFKIYKFNLEEFKRSMEEEYGIDIFTDKFLSRIAIEKL